MSAGGEEAAGSRPESPLGKAGSSPAPSNLITKFARVLTEEEKEEQRAKREREAAAAKQPRAPASRAWCPPASRSPTSPPSRRNQWSVSP